LGLFGGEGFGGGGGEVVALEGFAEFVELAVVGVVFDVGVVLGVDGVGAGVVGVVFGDVGFGVVAAVAVAGFELAVRAFAGGPLWTGPDRGPRLVVGTAGRGPRSWWAAS
jgi:hypothetical protein